jgi:hypothetical protein
MLQVCNEHTRKKNVPFKSPRIPISSGFKMTESPSWVPMKTSLVNWCRECLVSCLLVMYLGKVLFKTAQPPDD